MARVKAAAIQIAPDLSGCAGTVDRVVSSIEEASRQDVEIAVFPETFVPYYPYFSFVLPPALAGKEHMRLYEEAVEVPGPVTETFAEAARRHGMVLVIGVNERQRGTLYNCQLIFDADGTLVLKRRKITPSYHERMIWGRGDGSGLRVAKTKVGRIGALACWEHYNPLARFSLMAQHEEIHCAHFPGSMVGPIFADQIESTIRHHALESGCFRHQLDRLADPGADRLHYSGHKIAEDAAGRVHDDDHLAGRGAYDHADQGRRRDGGGRTGLFLDYETQAHARFGGALRPPRPVPASGEPFRAGPRLVSRRVNAAFRNTGECGNSPPSQNGGRGIR